ncbi:chemotaxis protein CheY [Mariprofundus micogutta]|uniref:Chemotaxis protein CheY n=2 Tax=Mariprofundus micogutta TaxID=1921010 RepID=A0A1L8CP86_9PROT|nr:chemotaxis protein CheY [Mariprofundus micogutta]
MDIVMPELGGIDAAQLMREINPNAKIIFATGYDLNESIEEGVDQHEEIVLHKPYSIIQLSQTLYEIFNA